MEMEPLVKSRITFNELLRLSKNFKRYPASINIPETIKELEKEHVDFTFVPDGRNCYNQMWDIHWY